MTDHEVRCLSGLANLELGWGGGGELSGSSYSMQLLGIV